MGSKIDSDERQQLSVGNDEIKVSFNKYILSNNSLDYREWRNQDVGGLVFYE